MKGSLLDVVENLVKNPGMVLKKEVRKEADILELLACR